MPSHLKTMSTRSFVTLVVLILVVGVSCLTHAAVRHAQISSKRMADGKLWLTQNLNVETDNSFCYEDKAANCHRYGRLYTWESAQRACRLLAEGWRLPTNDEWSRMAKHYGGVRGDSDDGGAASFAALVSGGSSGFNVVFGGGRDTENHYARIEAHGFYWTATETDSANAWFYNFGQAKFLNRHPDGEKKRAFSVRCIKD